MKASASNFRFLALVLGLMPFCTIQGQLVVSSAINNSTTNTCNTFIIDSGGQGGPGYSNNENVTFTICSDTPGDMVTVTFNLFDLSTVDTNPNPNQNNADQMFVYDGTNTSANTLGNYGGTGLQGVVIQATPQNPTGCLTFQFISNDAGTGMFTGSASCTTPCATPFANGVIVGGITQDSIRVCVNEPVTFQDQNSVAQPGFNLINYTWDFMDGSQTSVATPNTQVQHSFTQAGHYLVQLFVQDNNPDNVCTNANFISLDVVVATIPNFIDFQEDVTMCVGETSTILAEPQLYEVTWSGFDSEVTIENGCLPDTMLGISQNIDIFQMGFLAGTSIEDISQIESICLDMEHSYMGDLVIYVTCPNGQQVMLHQQGGGGTQIGVPNQADNIDCDDPSTQGTPYHYCFTPTASQTWVQWVTTTGGFGNTLPEGDYAAVQPIDQLVGCPTNGIWTLTVVDNWAADDGQLVGFQLNLDSALYPEVFEFTPQIDPNASSSYWNSNPAYGFINDSNSDELTIAPLAAGDYTYTYTVIDDFGCVNDTFFTAHVFEALQVAAPADLVYACGDITLQGWFANLPPPVCANCGTFSYCYNDGDNLTWTFCPDNPGDGTTLSFEFLSGQMEGWFETFTIYNGSTTSDPVLGTWTTGDATGQVWTATNTDGCLTVHFTSDASVSCASGSFQPWSYEISPGGPDYTWEWSPATYMDDPTLQAPTVSAVPQQTTYTVVGYPVGHPACASSDEVTVTIDPLGDPGLDATLTVCSNDAPFDLFSQLGGNPVTTGTWTDPNGNPLPSNPQFNPMTDAAGDYTYTVQMNACSAFATVHIDMNPPLQVTVANDTAVCYMGLLNMDLISTLDGNPPFTFQWTYNGVSISNAPDYNNYHPTNSGNACLTVTDVCGYAVQECFLVDVKPQVQPLIYSPVNTVCWPDPLIIQNLTDPTSFVTAVWNISDGFTTTNVDSLSHIFTNPGSYNVTLTLEDNIGCVYDTTAFGLLTAYAPPQANFQTNPQPAQADNTTITFTDLTLGEQIVNYYWVFDTTNVLGTADYANPVFTFPIGVGGDYPVNLVVVDINGCTDQTTGIVHINELLNIFIPNAFTPNGDNINDAIGFVGTDLDEKNFELTIFNRWGETVFHTKDVHAFWQGEANNGDYYVPNGAYNYIAHIRSISTGEKKVINGQIILDR